MQRIRIPSTLKPSKGVNVSSSVSGRRHYSDDGSISHRRISALDEWVQKEARPISLRQLTVFGRKLTEARLLSSANYVRTELPTRLAHRLRDLQSLPYSVIANPHMFYVYNLYYKAFDTFRKIREIKTVADNDAYCNAVRETLREHQSVIPRLVIGVLESQDRIKPEAIDRLMNTLLRSRISRRVIAEQHLALTESFKAENETPGSRNDEDQLTDAIGEVFLKCNAKDVVETCAERVRLATRHVYGPTTKFPEIQIQGHLDATFPYIPSHLEYMVGELLRNSFLAVIEQHSHKRGPMPPIEVLICETPQQVIFRISDQGGGVHHEILPHLWSFVKGPRRQRRLENLYKVPHLSATLQDLQVPGEESGSAIGRNSTGSHRAEYHTSLSSLSGRSPNLRLGIGLPMSRVYAEYWAGSLELHNLDGYGVDTFLQISKLGNKNEQLSTRAEMDAL